MRRAALAVGVLALAACGRFASGGATPATETVGADAVVGVTGSTTPATDPPPPSSAPEPVAEPSTPSMPTTSTSLPDVQASGPLQSVVERDGFLLVLTVGETVGGDLRMEVRVENRSGGTRHLDTNRYSVATIFDPTGQEAVWDDRACDVAVGPDPYEYDTGLLPLEDGEQSVAVAEHPGDPSCTLPPGDYVVVGALQWCRTVVDDGIGGRSCAPGAEVRTRTDPVAVTLV